MIECYTGALLVSAEDVHDTPLVIDTRSGRILPAEAAARAERHIDASGLVIYPGLINAHDHLELNHFPRTRWRDPHSSARQWAEDMRPHLDEEPYISLRRLPLADRCWHGGLKNLFCGVTTVAHHNPLYRPLRARDFPVRVLRRYQWAHSVYLDSPQVIQKAHRRARNQPFMIHLAEGTDAESADELRQLDALGCLTERTVLIHGVALTDPDVAIRKSRGLVWCPSTNDFLLGQTARVDAWFAAGKLALGSDSRLTADGDLLDELRAAFLTGQLDARSLFRAVTDGAARLLGLGDVGDLLPGKRADLLAIRLPAHGDVYRALVEARRRDVMWVMRDGHRLWEQATQGANFQLDGASFRLAPHLLKRLRKSRIQSGL
jgi:cytosine/adenosine deaminase-related metal-dependent hydrolase